MNNPPIVYTFLQWVD